MIITRDQAFVIVCNIRTPISDNRENVGTGSFIVKDNRIYLLTAAHVAIETNKNTYLALGDKKSNCIKVPIIELVDYLDWNIHRTADIAILEMIPNKHMQMFEGRCFPYDHINLTENIASRDDEITIIGFPNGLGIDGKFSPLTFRSHLSSGLITLKRADKNIYTEFFCLENPSMGGYSGAPVLDLGYSVWGNATSTKDKTIMQGVVHGTMSDNTGGKIALITPTYFLKDLL